MIIFGSNAIPSSWTLKLPESWDESKTHFKGAGEVDGFKIEEGEGEVRLTTPPPFLKSVFDSPQLSGSFNVQDGGKALLPKKIIKRAAKYACFAEGAAFTSPPN